MAYDESVAQRVREAIKDRDGLSERKMFGGLCLMLHGNMFAGVINDELHAARGDGELGRPAGPTRRSRHGLHRQADEGLPIR